MAGTLADDLVTPAALVAEATAALAAAGEDDARREAEATVAAALGCSRAALVSYSGASVAADAAARARAFIARRAAGEPLAYLTGRREFWSLDLRVTPDVLVPRPETELVVERVLALGGPGRRQFADLGTGSGAIALAVGRERPGWTILATDVSEAALAVARYNAAQLAMAHVEFALGSWFEACAGRRFELIASNPPYVAGDDHALGSRTLRHEPRAALTPGGDGLAAIDALVDGAPTHLVAGGWIVLEHGATQAADVAARLVARGFGRVRSAPDLAGHLRVTEGQWT